MLSDPFGGSGKTTFWPRVARLGGDPFSICSLVNMNSLFRPSGRPGKSSCDGRIRPQPKSVGWQILSRRHSDGRRHKRAKMGQFYVSECIPLRSLGNFSSRPSDKGHRWLKNTTLSAEFWRQDQR
jgi:hypothetical protein